MACHDVAVAYGTPFISGKDSLNNEFSYAAGGERRTIQIPHTLLISALGQVDDVSRCVTMDLKAPGNLLYQIGATKDELGGSHLELVSSRDQWSRESSRPRPLVAALCPRSMCRRPSARSPRCTRRCASGLVRACHDLSEGGLAVAVAEMAFAGNCGAAHSPGERARAAICRPKGATWRCCSPNPPAGSSSRSDGQPGRTSKRSCVRPTSPLVTSAR